MNFGGAKKKEAVAASALMTVKKECKGASPLLMYNHAPDGKLEFDEFATLALERFSVLQLVENVGTRHIKGSNDYMNKLDGELRKIGFLKTILLNPRDGVDDLELSKDIISHFILRLAFCTTEELKRWFIQQEVDLFRFKLSKISNETWIIQKFLQDNDLNYIPISESEKQLVVDGLIEMGLSHSQVMNQDFFKVNFLEVLELVKSRRVFLKGGFAYVTISDFGSVLTHVFRARLSKSLSTLSRYVKELEEDERISDLLRILRERDVGDNFAETQSKEQMTAESLDIFALKSYPLCMRHLHESLKQHHHLRHYGRLQYILFLKGIGLPLEENLRLFKGEFSRGTISVDKFDKEYAYNIRHSYGKEGKRTSYTPYSCLKIITSHMPGPGDHHGCPFKHFDREFLKQKLRQFGRSEDDVSQILEMVDNNNYQIACQKYFELTHKTDEIVSINHPNYYFEASQRIINGGNANASLNKSMNNVKREPMNIKVEHVKVEMTQ